MLAKGNTNFKLKADVLFRFYDVHSDNMVSYRELLKMVGMKRYSFTAIPRMSCSSSSTTKPFTRV